MATNALGYDAVLWDMDGTVVDTEPYWMEEEGALMAAHGLNWSHEQAMMLVGNQLTTSAKIMRSFGLPMAEDAIIDALITGVEERIRREIPFRPGAQELLTALNAVGVPMALVTMSYRSQAQAVVDGLPDGTFVTMITGDEVVHGKPHPEPYLRGAEALGVRPELCVAMEDSVPGMASAVAAGVPTIGIPNHVPLQPGPGVVLIETLAGVSPEDVGSLVRPLQQR